MILGYHTFKQTPMCIEREREGKREKKTVKNIKSHTISILFAYYQHTTNYNIWTPILYISIHIIPYLYPSKIGQASLRLPCMQPCSTPSDLRNVRRSSPRRFASRCTMFRCWISITFHVYSCFWKVISRNFIFMFIQKLFSFWLAARHATLIFHLCVPNLSLFCPLWSSFVTLIFVFFSSILICSC